MYIDTKGLPEALGAALRSVGYHKTSIELRETTQVDARVYGAEGQRGVVMQVELATGRCQTLFGSWGGPNPFETCQVDVDDRVRDLPPGVVVIKGTCGGRGVFMTLYAHPKNVLRALPKMTDLSMRELEILWVYKALTSAGRKDYWSRNSLRSPTTVELDALALKGFLKISKNGATQITTAGKNEVMHLDEYSFSKLR